MKRKVFSVFENLFCGEMIFIDFITAVISAAILGLIAALCYMYRSEYTKSFIITLATLPAVVAVIIMMVNGSIGAGIAVAGTFSLVRFRSAQGTAKEIGAIFISMAVGLICGMGYPAYAAVFTVIICALNILYTKLNFGGRQKSSLKRTLNIVVPEDLDYGNIFDGIMEKYTSAHSLMKVKTTDLGSLNKLTYDIVFKENGTEKQMIDELRCRNGNLEISISVQKTESDL